MKASSTGIAPAFRFLALALTASALVFTYAQLEVGASGPKFTVLAIMDILVLVMTAMLWSRRLSIGEEEFSVSGLFGTRSMRYDETTEVDVMELKGRMILVVTSDERFVFVSSMFSEFPALVKMLLEKGTEAVKKELVGIDTKKVDRMHRVMILFLAGASLALLGLAVYEMLGTGVRVVPL